MTTTTTATATTSHVGLELELLAPEGKTRFDVAAVAAKLSGGRVVYGLKHVVTGLTPEGRPVCTLSVAARVLGKAGETVCTIVDDVSVREHVDASRGSTLAVVIDDARISKWLEARSFIADEPDVFKLVDPIVETFGASLDAGGGAVRLVDLWGQVIAVVVDEPKDHLRVAEMVTPPLPAYGTERDAALRVLLAAAADSGCVIPETAALHVHVDAEPWKTTPALSGLVRGFAERREEILGRLAPNPKCKTLGPFPHEVVRVARECPRDLPFATLAAALKAAGATKELELNICGAIEKYPAQPTVEVRCLPMSLDGTAVLASVDEALRILDELRIAP